MSRYIDAVTLKVSILRYAEKLLSYKRLPITKKVAEEVINDVCFAIDVQKSEEDVTPVVHGHWIVIDNKDNKEGYMKMQCSVCGETLWSNECEEWYCCKCGAKMDEVKE